MRQIARNNQGSRKRKPCFHRILGELGQNILHWSAEVDLDHRATKLVLVDVGQVLRRMMLEFFQKYAVSRYFAQGLPVGGAGHAQPDRQRRAMPRQSYSAHVVAEIFAAELGDDAVD